jgi:hypothetical protein
MKFHILKQVTPHETSKAGEMGHTDNNRDGRIYQRYSRAFILAA